MGSGEFSVAEVFRPQNRDRCSRLRLSARHKLATTGETTRHSGFCIDRLGSSKIWSRTAGDTKVEIFVDQTRCGEFYNSATGFANNDEIKKMGGNYVPPFAQIHIIVMDAPATNPINGIIQWV